MDNFLTTYGGTSGYVSNPALTMSENQREMPIRSAGGSSGVGHNAADNSSSSEDPYHMLSEADKAMVVMLYVTIGSSSTSATLGPSPDTNSIAGSRSIPEEHNGLSQASHAQPTGDGNSAAGSSMAAIFNSWTNDHWEDQDMPAASTSTAASGLGPDVNNALLNGASQQVWDEDAGNSANMTAEYAPADPLAGFAQPAVSMGADSSTINNTLPPVNGGYPLGGAHETGYMGAGSSADSSVACDASPSGYVQQPQQAGAGSSANNSVAYDATLGGFNQPQMPMGAGSSTTTTFTAQQQYNFNAGSQMFNAGPNMNGHQQMAFNGIVQPFNPQMNAATQARGHPGAAFPAPLNGGMGFYGLPPANPVAANGMGQQQPLAFNGIAQPYMGQNQQTAARTRRQGDDNDPRKRRRTGAAPAGQALAGPAQTLAPAQLQVAVPQQIPVQQQVLVQQQVPVQQQVAVPQQVQAQEGPYIHTAAGVPNRDPTRKGNAQGQVPGWGQALKHHKSRCSRFTLNGCVPDCELHARWPKTWANWNTRRFQVRWDTPPPGHTQNEVLSGFAVAAKKDAAGLAVLGEVQADGSLGKAKSVLRVEKEAKK
ncbi:hypothetical protein Q7P35_010522 [Cladosporium inversicolor]